MHRDLRSGKLIGALASCLGASWVVLACAGASPDIERQLQQRTAELEPSQRACYERSATAEAGLPSRGEVIWELSALGNPIHVRAVTEPKDAELARCYERAVEAARFPAGYPHLGFTMRVDQAPPLDSAAPVVQNAELGWVLLDAKE